MEMADESAPPVDSKRQEKASSRFDIEQAKCQPKRVRKRALGWGYHALMIAGLSLAIACILVGVLFAGGVVTATSGGGQAGESKTSPSLVENEKSSAPAAKSRTTTFPAVFSDPSIGEEMCSSSCDTCYSVEGADLNHGIVDRDCALCSTGYKWWPCTPDLISNCICGKKPAEPEPTPPTPEPTPPPKEGKPVSPSPPPPEEEDGDDDSNEPPKGSTCSAACDTCVAAPGAQQCCGITDAHCQMCASGYKWWPCGPDTISKCLCNGVGEAPPSPAPTPGQPPSSPSPSPVCNQTDLESLISKSDWEKLFPHRNNQACKQNKYPDGSLIPGGFFEYDAFIKAAATYSCFVGQGSTETKKRELAAFLAQISHETTGGWPTAPDGAHAWGLCWKEEVGCETGHCTQYCAAGDPCTLNGEAVPCPCAAGKTYHGRGPMQLSWNYNYAPAGVALRDPLQRPNLDLLANPEKITEDPVLAFATAIFFWMSPRDNKPACHDVMTNQWTPSEEDRKANRLPGFGVTTNVINGGLECNIPNDYRVEDRVQYYLRYTKYMNVGAGDNLYCDKQRSFY